METVKEVNIPLIEAEFLLDFEKCSALKKSEIAEVEERARLEVVECEFYKELLEKQAKERNELICDYVKSECTKVEEKYRSMLNIYEKYITEREIILDDFNDTSTQDFANTAIH